MINCEPLWVAGLMLRDVYVYFVIARHNRVGSLGLRVSETSMKSWISQDMFPHDPLPFSPSSHFFLRPGTHHARRPPLSPGDSALPLPTAGRLGLTPFRASPLPPPEDSVLSLRPPEKSTLPLPRVHSPTVGGLGSPPSDRRGIRRSFFRASPLPPPGHSTLPLPTVGGLNFTPSARPLSHRRGTRPFPFRPPKDSTLPLPHVPFPTAAGFDFFPSDRRRIRLSPLPRVPSPIAGKFDIPPSARHLHLRHSDAAHARSWDARFVRNETRSFLLPAANDRAPLTAGRAFALTRMRPYIPPHSIDARIRLTDVRVRWIEMSSPQSLNICVSRVAGIT